MSFIKYLFILLFILFPKNNVTVAELKEYAVEVGDFKEITVRNSVPVDLVFSNDSVGIITFLAEDEASKAITFENKGGKLNVMLEPRTFGRDHYVPCVKIRYKSLTAISNEGDSLIRISDLPEVETIKIRLTGNGSISARNIIANEVNAALRLGSGRVYLTGSCEKAILDNTGQGILQAGGLNARTAICYIMGTGNIDCNASEELSVKGIGKGNIIYGGNPALVKNRGVGIKVEHCKDCD